MFEYGLWKYEELEFILGELYTISEIMYNLENHLYNDRNKSGDLYFKK